MPMFRTRNEILCNFLLWLVNNTGLGSISAGPLSASSEQYWHSADRFASVVAWRCRLRESINQTHNIHERERMFGNFGPVFISVKYVVHFKICINIECHCQCVTAISKPCRLRREVKATAIRKSSQVTTYIHQPEVLLTFYYSNKLAFHKLVRQGIFSNVV